MKLERMQKIWVLILVGVVVGMLSIPTVTTVANKSA